MPETKPNKGVLFPNDKRGNDRRPDMTGVVNIGGKQMNVAAWKRIDRRNKGYLSLSFTEPDTENREDNNGNS